MAASDLPASTAQSQTDFSGRTLGDYRILRRIGRGAMADVYLAEQVSLARQVALKVLKRELAEDETYVKRFQNEARAAAALVHSNIVQIHEVGCIDEIHFIALEYVRGQNLRQLLDRDGPLEARLAVTIMRQAAAALHRAAKAGVVHRDIKPENIMLSVAGEVKVADFGLSRIAGAEGVDLTQVGVTMGTPLYMSPEQAEGKKPDPRSDLYSFGVTFYHMLAGRPPFQGETALVVAMQHVRTSPDRLENLREDLPAGLCRIVHKLLEKSPDERYQDARELLTDLRELPIELDEDVGSEAFDDWGNAELGALAKLNVEATQRLDALMKSDARQSTGVGGRWPVALILAVVAAFVAGALAAWFTAREPDLLSWKSGEGPPQIEKMESAEAQYWHAMSLPTAPQREAAFSAVVKHWPRQTYYVQLAQQQIARIYLERGDFKAARRIFEEFANLGDAEPQLRAFGLAGLVICFHEQGKSREAAANMKQLLGLRDHLDEDMRRRIDAISP